MWTSLFTIHAVDQAKLTGVVAEMTTLGSPKIRVVDCGDYLMALEGTHRIAAAAQLGVALDLEILDQDDLVAADSLDWQNLCAGENYTAGELAGEAYSPSCGIYQLNADGTVQAE
jgi:hypothetical protein